MPGRGAGGTRRPANRSAPLRGGWAVGVGFGERGVAVGSEGEAGSGREAKVPCVLAMVLAWLMVRRLLAASLSLMEGEARQASQILGFSLSLSLSLPLAQLAAPALAT